MNAASTAFPKDWQEAERRHRKHSLSTERRDCHEARRRSMDFQSVLPSSVSRRLQLSTGNVDRHAIPAAYNKDGCLIRDTALHPN